ncbi:MAG: poly-gamma-glutamate hydrolase family protein [Cyanobacteria bacterium P01_E01_bin.42]
MLFSIVWILRSENSAGKICKIGYKVLLQSLFLQMTNINSLSSLGDIKDLLTEMKTFFPTISSLRSLLMRFAQLSLSCLCLGAIVLTSFSILSLPARADVFGCYEPGNVCAAPPPPKIPLLNEPSCLEGQDNDWETSCTLINNCLANLDKGGDVTVLSIHGGNIEPGTSEITEGLVETYYPWNRYDFKGHVTTEDCMELDPDASTFKIFHITSKHFNHQTARDLVAAHPKSVSIHGCGSSCSDRTICIGGRDSNAVTTFKAYVNQYKGLWEDMEHPVIHAEDQMTPFELGEPPNVIPYCRQQTLTGLNVDNIVNTNSSDGDGSSDGLQLEISFDLREELTDNDDDDYDNDLLRSIIYGGVGRALDDLPAPILATNGQDVYEVNDQNWIRHYLRVDNWEEYTPEANDGFEVFESGLSTCGLNENASRTWVRIYDNNDQYVYGFCALSNASSLQQIWFAKPEGQAPDSVYIKLIDKVTGKTYKSNRVAI